MTDLDPDEEQPVTLEDELEAWEMQPGESPLGYANFCLYRDLGPRRGLRQIARKSARDGQTEIARTGASLARITLWSKRWSWPDRAQAWDRHNEDARRTEIEDEHVEMARRQARIGMHLQNVAIRRILGDDSTNVMAMNPNDLKPGDVVRFALDGQKIERLARGEPDTIQQHQGPEGGPLRVQQIPVGDVEALANMRTLEDAGAVPSGTADAMARVLGIAVVDYTAVASDGEAGDDADG